MDWPGGDNQTRRVRRSQMRVAGTLQILDLVLTISEIDGASFKQFR